MRHKHQEPTLICGAFHARTWVDDAEKGGGGCMKRSRKTQDGGKGKQKEKTNQEKYKEQEKGKIGKRKQKTGRMKHTTQDRQTSRGVNQE